MVEVRAILPCKLVWQPRSTLSAYEFPLQAFSGAFNFDCHGHAA